MISRKIWVIEKSWNCHTVHQEDCVFYVKTISNKVVDLFSYLFFFLSKKKFFFFQSSFWDDGTPDVGAKGDWYKHFCTNPKAFLWHILSEVNFQFADEKEYNEAAIFRPHWKRFFREKIMRRTFYFTLASSSRPNAFRRFPKSLRTQ